MTISSPDACWGCDGLKNSVWVSLWRGDTENQNGERINQTLRGTCREGPQGGAGVARALTNPDLLSSLKVFLSETPLTGSRFSSHLPVPVSLVER